MRVRLLLLACGLILLATRCGSGTEPTPIMSIFASPRIIHDQGAKSTVSVDVTDEEKKARTGTVDFTAAAGSFGTGSTASVQLNENGNGEVEYTCVKAQDPNCKGAVRLEARWSQGEEFLVQVLRVEVVPFDAGVPDAGVRDGGP